MFEIITAPPTDQDLIELLAVKGMGWKLHSTSGHRPGSRQMPHAWRKNGGDRVHIMLFVGNNTNVEFDPLGNPNAAAELVKRMAAKGHSVEGWDLSTPDGRRSMCEVAADMLKTAITAEIKAKEEAEAKPPEQENHAG